MRSKGRQPRYLEIHDDLHSRIISGEYADGHYLPSERSLGEAFGVERVTVRRALSLLVEEGLIQKIVGSGSRVTCARTETQPDDPAEHTQSPSGPACRSVAFVIPGHSAVRISEPFMAEFFNDVAVECRKSGYNLFYTNAATFEELPDMIRTCQTDAVIWISEIDRDILAQAHASRIPSVVYGNRCEWFTCVELDHFSGSHQAVSTFTQAGHSRIAFINGIAHYLSAVERLKGFRHAMEQAGLPIPEAYIQNAEWTYESGAEAMQRLLDLPQPPTAVYCANDMMAIGAIKAINERGLVVPDDVSVIGFDNLTRAQQAVPPLTSIGCDTSVIAQVLGRYVRSLIEGIPEPTVRIILPVHLTARRSVASPRIEREGRRHP